MQHKRQLKMPMFLILSLELEQHCLQRMEQIFQGCNIENASFGLTNCAERTAIFKAVSEGYCDFECLAVYGDTKEPISPCGACRQVMVEFLKSDSKVILIAEDKSTVEMTVGELLPYSFTDLQ